MTEMFHNTSSIFALYKAFRGYIFIVNRHKYSLQCLA